MVWRIRDGRGDVRRALPLVCDVQRLERDAPAPDGHSRETAPAGVHRLLCLRCVRYCLELAACREDVPPGERDTYRVLRGRRGRDRAGRSARAVRVWAEGAHPLQWSAGLILGALKAVHGSVSVCRLS